MEHQVRVPVVLCVYMNLTLFFLFRKLSEQKEDLFAWSSETSSAWFASAEVYHVGQSQDNERDGWKARNKKDPRLKLKKRTSSTNYELIRKVGVNYEWLLQQVSLCLLGSSVEIYFWTTFFLYKIYILKGVQIMHSGNLLYFEKLKVSWSYFHLSCMCLLSSYLRQEWIDLIF